MAPTGDCTESEAEGEREGGAIEELFYPNTLVLSVAVDDMGVLVGRIAQR